MADLFFLQRVIIAHEQKARKETPPTKEIAAENSKPDSKFWSDLFFNKAKLPEETWVMKVTKPDPWVAYSTAEEFAAKETAWERAEALRQKYESEAGKYWASLTKEEQRRRSEEFALWNDRYL